jgi:hypothetical protein
VDPGAKADSTGVTAKCSIVGDGSFVGREVAVGTTAGAEAHAFKRSEENKIKSKLKRNFFMAIPQRKPGALWIILQNITLRT